LSLREWRPGVFDGQQAMHNAAQRRTGAPALDVASHLALVERQLSLGLNLEPLRRSRLCPIIIQQILKSLGDCLHGQSPSEQKAALVLGCRRLAACGIGTANGRCRFDQTIDGESALDESHVSPLAQLFCLLRAVLVQTAVVSHGVWEQLNGRTGWRWLCDHAKSKIKVKIYEFLGF